MSTRRVLFLALFVLAVPSCASSTKSAAEVAADSYVRQPDPVPRTIRYSGSYGPATFATPGSSAGPYGPLSGAGASQDPTFQRVARQCTVRTPFPWRYVVIHHSASASGDAQAFDAQHKKRGWDGLGYHFVIGNGTSSGIGEIEVGYRWAHQLQGAHAGSYIYNRYGIGVCLVGNFDQGHPSGTQLASLERLVAYLMDTYRIPPSNVIVHRDVRETKCPGRYFPMGEVMAGVARYRTQF